MYGVQVISESADCYECIMYMAKDVGSRIRVMKLSEEQGVYAVLARGDEVAFVSRKSYAEAFFQMFPNGSLNMTGSGFIVPCTPARYTGKEIFRVWQSNDRVFLEALTINSQRWFVELNANKAFVHFQSPEVWFGFYRDVKRLMLCVVVSESWNANFSVTVTYEVRADGVSRRQQLRQEWHAKYKTLAEISMGV